MGRRHAAVHDTALHERLTAAPSKRLTILPEGTHTMLMERNRMKLFETVQRLLDSGS